MTDSCDKVMEDKLGIEKQIIDKNKMFYNNAIVYILTCYIYAQRWIKFSRAFE